MVVRRTGLIPAGLALGVAWLAGCTGVSRSTIDSIGLVWHGSPKLDPTAEQVRANPYFQMRASIAEGDAILILGNIVGSREYWYGPKGIYVSIPFDLLLPRSTQARAGFVWDPLIRDGGAMLSRRYTLYSLTDDRDLDNFNRNLDKIVE